MTLKLHSLCPKVQNSHGNWKVRTCSHHESPVFTRRPYFLITQCWSQVVGDAEVAQNTSLNTQCLSQFFIRVPCPHSPWAATSSPSVPLGWRPLEERPNTMWHSIFPGQRNYSFPVLKLCKTIVKVPKSLVRWSTAIIPTLGKLRQKYCEFQAYIASSKPVQDTYKDCLKKQSAWKTRHEIH
jgi:hypothetical protein